MIGVSGGLDSTHALLVCAKAMDLLGLPRSQHPRLHDAGLRDQHAHARPGAAPDGGGALQRRRDRHPAELPADAAPTSAIRTPKGEPQYDITFENVQAGERTSHLFRLANFHGGIVVGTGDLSELALGWSTYGVGDHMSHYNVNASVPKTLIKHLVRWVAESGSVEAGDDDVLDDILATEVSPELVPGGADGPAEAEQRGERRPVRAAGLPPLLHPALRLCAEQGRLPGLHRVARPHAGRVARRSRRRAQRIFAGRDQEAPAHLPATASSRPASSSAPACRTRRRSARAARSRRAATGARRATRKRRCGWTN